MKRFAMGAVLLLVLVSLGAVAYRVGWLAKLGVPLPGVSPAGSASAASGTPSPASPGIAGAPSGGGSPESGPSGSAAATGAGPRLGEPVLPPKFDGNIALLDFGATVERTTENYGDTVDHRALIDGDRSTPWRSVSNHPGIAEVVLSFFGREPVLIDRLTVQSDETAQTFPRDVEVLVSSASADGPFTKLVATTLPLADEASIAFAPTETRFLKFRMIKNHDGEELFRVTQLKVHEVERAGYVSVLSRHAELTRAGGPVPMPAGMPPVSSALPPCAPSGLQGEQQVKPGHPESNRVLVVGDHPMNYGAVHLQEDLRDDSLRGAPLTADDKALLGRVQFTMTSSEGARPAMLAPALGIDTVVLAQVCDAKTSLSLAFKQTLVPWVASGHKLIIQDSDDCKPGPDYSFLPYRFQTDNPGALGERGSDLRVLESNVMLNDREGRPGFLDAEAWVQDLRSHRNELGDANTVVAWDPNWCGNLAVRNVHGVFGFSLAYAHYGRGLIVYDGFDNDQAGEAGYNVVLMRALEQGFDPDGLPCGARLGDFTLTTDARLRYLPIAPGRSYSYPLTLLPNQGYTGTVALAAATTPAVEGLQARIDPASLALANEGRATLTLTLPSNAKPAPLAVEVRGTDAAGKTNALCLQLGPPKGGDLAVVSALAPPTKTRKNIEIILDASGSMKTLMGKKSRWDTALETLKHVLTQLPEDFNVGLRIYGHREASTSPKACTDSELVVPIDKLDRQRILSRAAAYKPKGETPLVYSALQAPADLKAIGGGTVILITDGEESCKGDPVKAAAELKASGLDIRLSIVGFGVTNTKVQTDLAGFSQATGGLFYAAQSGEALGDALLVAAIEKFPYTVYDAAGKVALTSAAGSGSDVLPPGDYKVVVKAGSRELVAPRVSVGLGQSVTLTIAMKNGQVVLQ